MPSKPKFTREQIIEVAFELLKSEGKDCVSARNIAKKLNCAVSPIFTLFSSMDEIKQELYRMVKNDFLEYINEAFKYDLPFKEFGIRWIMYAKENKYFFETIFSENYIGLLQTFLKDFKEVIDQMLKNVEQIFKLSSSEAEEVFKCLTLQVEGITQQILSRKIDYSKNEVSHILGMTCLGIVNLIRLRNGTFDEKIAKVMSDNIDHEPIKIRK